jgi:preprotein translocase subunit YajC
MFETLTTPSETTMVIVSAQDAAAGQPGLLSSLPMIIIIFGIFYFLLIRPQQKEQKKHKSLLSSLIKGQNVVTTSGLHGRIYDVAEADVVLEVSNGVRVTVDKVAIKRRIGEG